MVNCDLKFNFEYFLSIFVRPLQLFTLFLIPQQYHLHPLPLHFVEPQDLDHFLLLVMQLMLETARGLDSLVESVFHCHHWHHQPPSDPTPPPNSPLVTRYRRVSLPFSGQMSQFGEAQLLPRLIIS